MPVLASPMSHCRVLFLLVLLVLFVSCGRSIHVDVPSSLDMSSHDGVAVDVDVVHLDAPDVKKLDEELLQEAVKAEADSLKKPQKEQDEQKFQRDDKKADPIQIPPLTQAKIPQQMQQLLNIQDVSSFAASVSSYKSAVKSAMSFMSIILAKYPKVFYSVDIVPESTKYQLTILTTNEIKTSIESKVTAELAKLPTAWLVAYTITEAIFVDQSLGSLHDSSRLRSVGRVHTDIDLSTDTATDMGFGISVDVGSAIRILDPTPGPGVKLDSMLTVGACLEKKHQHLGTWWRWANYVLTSCHDKPTNSRVTTPDAKKKLGIVEFSSWTAINGPSDICGVHLSWPNKCHCAQTTSATEHFGSIYEVMTSFSRLRSGTGVTLSMSGRKSGREHTISLPNSNFVSLGTFGPLNAGPGIVINWGAAAGQAFGIIGQPHPLGTVAGDSGGALYLNIPGREKMLLGILRQGTKQDLAESLFTHVWDLPHGAIGHGVPNNYRVC